MAKKETTRAIKPVQGTTHDREEKILNVMCNTSILLMSLMTEAFSDLFAGMAEGMAHAVTTNLRVPEENTKEGTNTIQDLKTKIPQHFRKQMIAMKTDISNQFYAKKQDLQTMIADPIFDRGIEIAESYKTHLPTLTKDLDEVSFLGYIALLKANDPRCTKMFQELMEWIKTVPQPPK